MFVMRLRVKPASIALLGVCCLAVLHAGCSERAGGTRCANLPPETFITSGPGEEERSFYIVEAYWYGADPDGCIRGFDVAIVRDMTKVSLGRCDYDSLPWGFTTSKESTFFLPADSCCTQDDDVWLSLSHWCLLVRAIDTQGAKDPEPASVFFEASNRIPQVRITVPNPAIINHWPTGTGQLPPQFYLGWQGGDPDGNPGFMHYKYLTIAEDEIAGGKWPPDPGIPPPWLPPLDRDSSGVGHGAPPVGWWSEWVRSDCTYVSDLDLSDYVHTERTMVTFVTVRDEAGAVLPENLFEWAHERGENYLRYVVVDVSGGTPLIIDGGILGRRRSTNEVDYRTNIASLFYPTEILFTFWAREGWIYADIEAYRYYYDSPDHPFSMWDHWTPVDPIREEGSFPEWFVTVPPDGLPFIPAIGPHVLVVEVRNLNQVISHCEFHIEVLEGPRHVPEKKILLIDDDHAKYIEPAWRLFDENQTDLWDDILDGYNWERFYTGERSGYDHEVPVRLVGSATTVIWLADDETYETRVSQLLRVCTEVGNYLHSYVKAGGNLIVIGRDPIRATAYWPDWAERMPGRPHPDDRANFRVLDFSPRAIDQRADTLYNFNWEVFGIKRMEVPAPRIPYNKIWPCDACGAAWEDTLDAISDVGSRWWEDVEHVFNTAFYITDIRSEADARFPLYVEPMYTTACDTSGVLVPATGRFLAVYVPGDERRGHAAYIGFPAYWFDHDKIKVMIRRLLESFGEQPVSP